VKSSQLGRNSNGGKCKNEAQARARSSLAPRRESLVTSARPSGPVALPVGQEDTATSALLLQRWRSSMETPETPLSRRRQTLARRVLKWLGLACVGLVLLLLIGIAALQSAAGRRFVLSRVAALLAAQQIDFNADDLRYNLLDLSLDLRGVTIKSARRATDPPFAVIRHLTADLSLHDLVRGKYVVESGSVDGIRVRYLVDENGDNLPRPLANPDEPSRDLDYLIEELSVTDVEVRYENRVQQIDAVVPVQSVTIKGHRATDRHDVTLASANGRVMAGRREFRLERLDAAVDLGKDDVKISRATLEAEGSQLKVSGSVTGFSAPVLDVHVQAALDAARAAQLAGLQDTVAGRVGVEAAVKGPAASPSLDGRIEGRQLGYRTIRDLSVDADLEYDGRARQLSARSVNATAPWGAVQGNGEVSLDQGASRAALRVSGIDLPTLLRGAGLTPVVVASRIDATANLTWPALDYAAASGSADVTLRPTRAGAARSTIPIAGRVSARGDGSRLVATVYQLTAAGATVEGHVTLADRDRLGGDLRATVGDVGRTAAAAEAFLGRAPGALMSDRVAGALDANVALGGTIRVPIADASIDAPALNVAQAGTLALSSDLRYTPAIVTLRTADVAWGDARAHTDGRIGLAPGQPIDLRFDVTALSVPAVLAVAGQNPDVAAGTLALNGTANGNLAHPKVDATLRGVDLVAAGEPLGTLDVHAALSEGRVEVDRLALEKPQPGGNGQLTGAGSYDLNTRAYTFDARSADLRLVNVALPDGRRVAGTIALTGNGAGTVESPAGTLRGAITNLSLGTHELGTVELNATAANGRADVKLSATRLGLQSTAAIELKPTYPSTVEARIQNLDLQQLPLEVQTRLTGRVSANATASLQLTQPRLAHVQARIDAFEGSWNQQPFALQAPAVLGLADEQLTIERLAVAAQDSTVTVAGTLPLNAARGDGALSVEARANLETLARYAPADAGLTASGSLRLAGTVRGNLQSVVPDLQLTIENAAVTTPDLGAGVTNLTAQAHVGDGTATLEQLSANWVNATIRASATVPLDLVPALPVEIPRRGGPANFTADVTNLDLATVPGAPEDLKGVVSLTATGEAARPDVAALDATVTFPELRVALRNLDLAQDQPSTVRIASGRAQIERFKLSGSAGTLAASGTVGLTGERPIDVHVDGDFNTAVAASFVEDLSTEGRAVVQVAAAGTVGSPRLNGTLALNDVTLAMREPNIAAENVNARVDLANDRVTLSTLRANLNGGTLTGSGGLAYRKGQLEDVDVQLNVKDLAFDAPLDLRSLSDSTIRVTKQGDDFLVGGNVLIREGGLTGDVNFDTGLLATLNQPRALDLTRERNPLLERVNFSVQVATASPILIDNNLAKAEVRTNLRVVGTPYETGLTGTLTVLEGGEIRLNERQYHVERAAVTFLEERRIVPSFDLHLTTQVNNFDVTLAVTGEPGDTETTLTSDPALPEPDIMALLVTGRTLEQMRGEEADIAKEQVLSYLAGRVGSQLGRTIERATGLSEVRLEPNLIANETDPSARLTVAQALTQDLQLIFSTDLANSNDQIWVARYDVTRRFQTNAVRQEDGSYRLDFRHDVRFGGLPPPRREPRRRARVAAVNVKADGVLGEAELRDRLGFKPGDEFDYFAARKRIEKIEKELQKQGRLQSRVRLARSTDGDAVALDLRVEAGPSVAIAYKGMQPPATVDRDVREQWNRGVFDSQRAGDARERLVEWLMRERYLRAVVESRIDDSSEARRVVFTVTPGPRFARIELAFAGASAVSPDVLDDIVHEQKLERKVFTDPVVVTELLRRYYREEGYLSAELDKPKYEYQGDVARAVIEVREGPRFTIRAVAFTGNRVFDSQKLASDLPTKAGDPFLPRAAEAALERLRDLYWRQAYNDMRSRYSLVLDRANASVNVTFEIEERDKSVIADVQVAGNRKTSDRLVTEQLEMQSGQPLDLAALGRSRRNLYNTGAFSMVDITRTPVEAGSSAPATPDDVKPVKVDVNLREVQPIQVRYGASYDTERGLGGILDASNHNTLGKARVLGFAAKYDSNVRDGRIYLTQPALRYWPIATTVSVYYREERNPDTQTTDPFDVDRRGVSLQQERKLANSYVWTYGYRWERARKFDPLLALRGDWVTVSPLTSTFTRETRDEVLDATRGSFISHAFSYSPSWLGGDEPYIKYYGQYFHYWPLQPERRKRFTNEMLRPRLVYATGVRVGLAAGFGGSLLPETERFYAGGSTTLRGFEQNAVGPVGPTGIPTGGQSLLVLNNELRFPLVSIVDGVGFVDIGGVFGRVRDFRIPDLRQSGGVGLRIRTPWFLVRGDYGIVLDPRPGEPRSRFYFSIGQAF